MKAPAEVSAKRHILAAIVSVNPILPRALMTALRGTCNLELQTSTFLPFWHERILRFSFHIFSVGSCLLTAEFSHA
jgi:hypothetical protein